MFNPYLLRLDPINLLNVNLLYSETFVERVVKEAETPTLMALNARRDNVSVLARMDEILILREGR